MEWLEKIDLPQVVSWRIDRLSKGMSQKVQIAATLMSEPEVCIMDEPTTGLDPVNVRLVQDLLIERRKAGRTTMLSTHQMSHAEVLCDRVALIHRGRLMVYGGVDDVRRRSFASGGTGARARRTAGNPRDRRGRAGSRRRVADYDGGWQRAG